MNLTPEQQELGRRNFLKAVATTPALAALGVAALTKGPLRGGPVRLGYVGLGGQGRVLLAQTDPAHATVPAICDVNPSRLQKADEVLAKAGMPPARHYDEWKTMLEKEDLEAVVLAVPLWLHAEVTAGCLEAGKHVLCEKMMAWDAEGCRRMQQAAKKTGRLLEIGYQRFYNPVYQAAYQGIVKTGGLGEVYHARLVWHRNGSWRRKEDPPSPDFDPSRWGYPTFDHLVNWRLYWQYSQGLMAELASHQVNIANWFFGASPEAVLGSGGVYRWKNEGREVPDHVYATFEYPGGITGTFSSGESNAFEERYEAFYGTKGTLIIRNENEAMLFAEGDGAARQTSIEAAPKGPGALLETSETKPLKTGRGPAKPAAKAAPTGGAAAISPSTYEINAFCSAIRSATALNCGPEKASHSASWTIAANEALKSGATVKIL